MLSAVFATLFGLSLLPGRKPLCLRFAERISDGIMPEGAVDYCRRLTWIWFFVLLFSTSLSALSLYSSFPFYLVSLVVVPLTFLIERPIRNRRFRVVFHTSGSTGKSKEIIKTFETLAKEVAYHRAHYRELFNGDDKPVFLGTIQWHHMYGKLWMDLLPKSLGAKYDEEVIMTPEALVAKMREQKRVFLITTPSFLDRFTAYADQYEVPRNCVEIITSGALLTKDVSDRTERVFGIAPRQIFGSTETGGVAWRRFPEEIFHVMDPVKVNLDDGRIGVKSPFSFRRYYVMGDGIELAADARSFKLLGRRDRLVKINEERVNLAEMEEKVRALGYRDCALAKLDGKHGPYLGLVLVGGEEENSLELRKKFVPVFPTGTVPKRFRFAADLPRNPQGKVIAAEIAKLLEEAK